MIHAQNKKRVALLKPQSVTSQTTVSATVNVVGWDYAEIVLHLDTAAASSTESTILVTESDDATTYTTSSDLTMTTVAPDTSNQQLYVWFLDLRKRKKFLKITYMPTVAKLASATATLSRAEVAPTTAAGRGVTAQVVA